MEVAGGVKIADFKQDYQKKYQNKDITEPEVLSLLCEFRKSGNHLPTTLKESDVASPPSYFSQSNQLLLDFQM